MYIHCYVILSVLLQQKQCISLLCWCYELIPLNKLYSIQLFSYSTTYDVINFRFYYFLINFSIFHKSCRSGDLHLRKIYTVMWLAYNCVKYTTAYGKKKNLQSGKLCICVFNTRTYCLTRENVYLTSINNQFYKTLAPLLEWRGLRI